ncbi:unnamed protein product [Calypogeia fissa]
MRGLQAGFLGGAVRRIPWKLSFEEVRGRGGVSLCWHFMQLGQNISSSCSSYGHSLADITVIDGDAKTEIATGAVLKLAQGVFKAQSLHESKVTFLPSSIFRSICLTVVAIGTVSRNCKAVGH